MTTYRVIVSSAATQEVADAVTYIASETSADAASQWLEGLEGVFRSLREMPQRFPVAREDGYFPHGTLRRALHHKHRILFTIDAHTVRVLHVRHGMRDELTEI